MCSLSVRSRALPAGDRPIMQADMTRPSANRGAPALHDEPSESGLCAVPGCGAEATHKAPRSRRELDRYVWFCLEHVREYNAAWNYYAGMDEGQIEAHRREDVTWRRPTWPLGAGRDTRRERWAAEIDDPLDLLGERFERRAAPPERPPSPTDEALGVLGLVPPVTASALKARYIELVKRLHPDANGGDKTAEERLKLVNEAYTTLKLGVGPGG